jgi:hypothetical protein
MNWKWILAVGAIAGAALAARRRSQKAAADSDLWAAATDPVAPSGS